ncbi:MAG TPA: TerC family protein [Luteibaculaceae bacterium]|nr:TerC family protein [Luteibaculaceae bacterium]
MLAIDLGIFNKKSHRISNKEALTWSAIWISTALIFSIFIYFFIGKNQSSEFLTAFLIEKALSVDNLFVFVLIFQFFKVPESYQHKVLFWGILGAIALRAVFIFSGVWIVESTYLPAFDIMGYQFSLGADEEIDLNNGVFHRVNAILTVFGLFLIYAGIKSAKSNDDSEQDFSDSVAVRVVRKLFPVTKEYDGDKFWTWQNGKRFATPLFLVVAVVETTDLIFAVDSIPAIFAVSRDPFILYTSNIFAILGLRALYFLLANSMDAFIYLHYGLAVILTFIGVKMVISPIMHISSTVSLSIVGGVLFTSGVASVLFKKKS